MQSKFKIGDIVKWNEVGGPLTDGRFTILSIQPNHNDTEIYIDMELICDYRFKPVTTTQEQYIDLA